MILSLMDEQKVIRHKSFIFIRNCIYNDKVKAKEVIDYMMAIITET